MYFCFIISPFALMQNVAILDVPEFHEVGIDLHRDLRLDIEDMSYEVTTVSDFLL